VRPSCAKVSRIEPISGTETARVVTLEEHVAYAGHPEGLPAIGPTVASAGAGPWASTIRSSPDRPVQSPHLKAVNGLNHDACRHSMISGQRESIPTCVAIGGLNRDGVG
jgi:hypothetical protein